MAPRRIGRQRKVLKSLFLGLLGWVGLAHVLACGPSVEETASRLRAEIERSPTLLTEGMEGLLDPGSQPLLREVSRRGGLPEILQSLREVLTRPQPDPGEPGLLRTDDPAESLYFVRDGHGMRLNLALSGAWFALLRSFQYPRPW